MYLYQEERKYSLLHQYSYINRSLPTSNGMNTYFFVFHITVLEISFVFFPNNLMHCNALHWISIEPFENNTSVGILKNEQKNTAPTWWIFLIFKVEIQYKNAYF